ncbi:MAG TPA: response regulator transcription factor, partial [Thermomicrobiales bacterium]|nr:response regulator transcription factor [Thermomicrobiales bacterium]
HLLAAFAPQQPTRAPLAPGFHTPPGEPLSDRELAVLRLLAQRYRNKEIADALSIAPATVKTHTLNIYRKLDAADRREAVARAADLGLLPPVEERLEPPAAV